MAYSLKATAVSATGRPSNYSPWKADVKQVGLAAKLRVFRPPRKVLF